MRKRAHEAANNFFDDCYPSALAQWYNYPQKRFVQKRGGVPLGERRGFFADVILDGANIKINKPLTYGVPEHLSSQAAVGCRVWVPLGRKLVEGYVVALKEEPGVEKVKYVEQVLGEGPVFSEEQVELARWISEYYLCPLVKALKLMLPPGSKVKLQDTVRLRPAGDGAWEEAVSYWDSVDPRAAAVIDYLSRHEEVSRSQLLRRSGLEKEELAEVLELLREHGLVEEFFRPRQRKKKKESPDGSDYADAAGAPGGGGGGEEGRRDASSAEDLREGPCGDAGRDAFSIGEGAFSLTPEQERVIAHICARLRNKERGSGLRLPVLVHGVTGSGKTEIYIHAAACALAQGQGVIVLVPEIALTPQTYTRFQSRFGSQVAVLHSGITGLERRREWERIKEGRARVVVGARSAIFAPVQNLGLIILDEEQETSYKQDNIPRYHCREVARKRAEINGALLIMGSATPMIETRYWGDTGEAEVLELTERVEGRPLPRVEVVDLREEIRAGNFSIFSRLLRQRLNAVLERGEQAILFLNRRGFSTFVNCRNCGLVLRCPRCEVALTYHQQGRQLRCHYCNYHRAVPVFCPQCQSRYLRYFGLGTERVEEEVRQFFPEARVVRMDIDTAGSGSKGAEILRAFQEREKDILVGTQLIAKGLDFPGVTLVGVITADISLNQPDFRAAERTFQLLTQVAGRAGRGDMPGEVVVQTYTPQHYSILAAQTHDYDAFYRAELQYRRQWGYPPFWKLCRLLVSGPLEDRVRVAAELLGRYLEGKLVSLRSSPERAGEGAPAVLGPAPAPLSRLRGQYRWQIMLKSAGLSLLQEAVRAALEDFQRHNSSLKVSVAVDVEPLSML